MSSGIFHKKKQRLKYDLGGFDKKILCHFSTQHVSTGQVNAFIKLLISEFDGHYGYYITNVEPNKYGSIHRFVIYTTPGEHRLDLIWFFKDRTAGMIEGYCRKCEPVAAEIKKWDNGFEEYIPY